MGGRGEIKGAKYMVTEDDFTLACGHTMQYTDHVSEIYTLNLYGPINQCHPNKFNKKGLCGVCGGFLGVGGWGVVIINS